jgi:hypothetical protein
MSQDKYAGKLKTLSITNETSLYPFPGASYDFPHPFSDLKKTTNICYKTNPFYSACFYVISTYNVIEMY